MHKFLDGENGIDFYRPKKIIILDWDGTIFDSMKIKMETFSTVLAKIVTGHISDIKPEDRIEALYKKLSGRPRKEIFEAVLSAFDMQKALVDYEEFNRSLMETNKIYLEKARIFSDAEMLLGKLINDRKIIFISSSVPQAELDYFTSVKLSKKLLLDMTGILGSSDGFGKGDEHFNFIMRKTGLAKDCMLFIGDDLSDFQLSAGAGVDFIMVDRKNRFHSSDFIKVPDLTVIGEMVK